MRLSEFQFILPPALIAQHPVENREDARLMVVHKDTGKIEHKVFKDVLDYFEAGDTFVLNDTKVFAAKIYGHKEKTQSMIEVFLLRELNSEVHLWDALVDPARKIRVGNKLYFGNDELVAEVLDNTTSRGRTLKFLFDGATEELYKIINQLGESPLPKQIKRKVEPTDQERYQTIYAKHTGSIVAPMAGLHFTPHLLKFLEIQGINIAYITLHIGLGTLLSIDVEDFTKHKINAENFQINSETAQLVNKTIANNQQICMVGTSTAKAIESSVSMASQLKPTAGWTNKFIFPEYKFKIGTSLITNFHLPKSTLMMNAAAFAGYELTMQAYQTAIKEKYRFFTYGDAMLII